MRLKITFAVQAGSLLPLSYQYELSAWVYRVLSNAQPEFATWLHNKGYDQSGKNYKLFTFSSLHIAPFTLHQESNAIEVRGNSITWEISFFVEDAVKAFVQGLFTNERFTIGTKALRPVQMQVRSVELLPLVEFEATPVLLKMRSPLCLAMREENNMYPTYISPTHKQFEPLFKQHLLGKYASLMTQFDSLQPLPANAQEQIRFKLLSEPTSRLVTIKAFTSQQSKIRGFIFDFELSAPPSLLHLAYYGGFGEKTSLGFGYAALKNK